MSLPAFVGAYRRCVQIVKHVRAKPAPPQMADHPPTHFYFFTTRLVVGLDYFGPLEVTIGRRVEKRWVALFTYLTIRDVHLEVVHSLNKHVGWPYKISSPDEELSRHR